MAPSSSKKTDEIRRVRVVDYVLAGAMLGVAIWLLLPFFAVATCTHAQCDDYLYASRIIDHGFWGAQVAWYKDWTGRFSSTFVLSLVALLPKPNSSYPYIPILTLMALITALWTVARRVLPHSFKLYRVPLAALATAALLAQTRAPGDTVLWNSGAVTYTWALIGVLVLGVLLSRPRPGLQVAGVTALAFFLTGFNELAAIAVCVMGFAGVTYWLFQRKRPPGVWICVAVAGLIGLVATAAAPGNALRSAMEVGARRETRSIVEMAGIAFEFSLGESALFATHPATLGLCAFGVWVAFRVSRDSHERRWIRPALVGALLSLVLVALLPLGPSVATWARPSWRVLDFTGGILVTCVPITAGLFALWLRERRQLRSISRSWPAAMSIIIVLLSGTYAQSRIVIWSDWTSGRAHEYDKMMRTRYEQIQYARLQGKQTMAVEPLPDAHTTPLITMDLDSHPEDKYCRAWGIVFGLHSIYLTEGPSRYESNPRMYGYR